MNQVLQAAQIGSRAARLRCEFSIGQSIGHVIVWVVLTLVTFGLALLVFPYYLNRTVLNRTEVRKTISESSYIWMSWFIHRH